MDMKTTEAVEDNEALLARHDYIIIDRAALADESELDGLPVEPLVPRILQEDADNMPVLVPLAPGAEHMEMLAYHLESAKKGYCACMIACMLTASAPDGRMSAHLSRRLVLHSPRGGKDLLRYHDPRVFPQLIRILKPEQLRALYGPIRTWSFMFQQKWISHPVPEVTGVVPEFWSVDDGQHAQLARVIQLNTVLAGRKKQLGRPWADLAEYLDASRTADKALELAQTRYRLDEASAAVFAQHALAHGEYFHLHPRIQALLRVARRSKEMPYAATAAVIDAPAWETIEVESFHQHKHS
jgi:hypothetical protein